MLRRSKVITRQPFFYFTLLSLFIVWGTNAHAFPVYKHVANKQSSASNPLITKIAVLGKDDRIKLPAKYRSLAIGIGILGQAGKHGWSCTAFCVAPNIVATNAHCIVKNPSVGKRLDLSKTVFYLPALKNKSNKKHKPKTSNYRQRITHPDYVIAKNPALSIYYGNFRNVRSVNSQSHDWAFTKLKQSVCKGRTLKFATVPIKQITKAAKQKQLFMIGFHGDKKMQERLYSKNCKVRSPTNRRYFLKAQRRRMARKATLLPHTCDAYKGSSGSPIIITTKDGPKVVGINLGSLRYDRYKILKNRYTGKVVSRKKIRASRETNMAVRPSAFLKGLSRFEKETLLNTPADLKQVQTLLKEFKLYRGKIDGIYGHGTRHAVTQFEKKKNLVPISLPTQELLGLLEQDLKTKKLQQTATNNKTKQ